MSTNPQDRTIESLTLDVDGRAIVALRRPPRSSTASASAPRLLCLHGWLDNAASYVPMMPHLPDVDLIAIDLPGHGESAHLDGNYTLHEMSYRVRRALQCLGWERCHLVGHSLGGCVAPAIAVAAPDAIASLVLIEASGPVTEEADALPARLVRALAERLDGRRFQSRTFPDAEAAVGARLKSARMDPASARLIIDRQLVRVDGGWRWRFDPQLRAASAQYQTEAQVRSVLAAVACPTLTVIAEDGFLARREETEARLSLLADRTSSTLPGHHHVHMDTPEPVARAIRHFLAALPQTS